MGHITSTKTPSPIASIRRGSLTIRANSALVSVTIPSVDPSKTSVRLLAAISQTAGNRNYGSLRLWLASATRLELIKDGNVFAGHTASTHILRVSYEVIEFV